MATTDGGSTACAGVFCDQMVATNSETSTIGSRAATSGGGCCDGACVPAPSIKESQNPHPVARNAIRVGHPIPITSAPLVPLPELSPYLTNPLQVVRLVSVRSPLRGFQLP